MQRIRLTILCCLVLGPAGVGHPAAKPLEFGGEISRGQTLVYRFEHDGTAYEFRLVPTGGGWTIWIDEPTQREHNYVTAVTPPFRGVNPAVIEGWHFRNEEVSAPDNSDEGKVSAPQMERHFGFVTNSTAYQKANEALTILLRPEGRTEEAIRSAEGRLARIPRVNGVLRIEAIELGNSATENRPRIEHMAFAVRLELP